MPRKNAEQKLLIGYLERVSGLVFERYPESIRRLTRGRSGVYALYKGDRLYYVGLASNLMPRLKTHLKDRHARLWDRFSVYVTRSDDHIKELESIFLRIAKPPGNRVKGGLKGAASLSRQLKAMMTESDADSRARLLGGNAVRQRRRRKTQHVKGTLVLAGLVERRLPLKAVYKGETYRATLRRDGYISFRGKLFESPSAAAKVICRRPVNGWGFWHFKRSAHNWPRLRELKH